MNIWRIGLGFGMKTGVAVSVGDGVMTMGVFVPVAGIAVAVRKGLTVGANVGSVGPVISN
jgi:hypothetical protein